MSGYNVPRRREALVLLLVWSCCCVFLQSNLVGADLVSLPNVQRCASDAGTNKCRLCDPSLPSFTLDMTSPLNTALNFSYDLGGLGRKWYFFEPCGFQKPVPAPQGYPAGCSSTNASACYCHPDFGECVAIGHPETSKWKSFAVDEAGVPAYAAVGITYSHNTRCFTNECGSGCSIRVVATCNANAEEPYLQELNHQQPGCQGYGQQTGSSPCHACLAYRTNAVCEFKPCPDNCNGHGKCAFGECKCDDPWVGYNCASSPDCTKQGSCSHDATCTFTSSGDAVCKCRPGYIGDGKQCDADPSASTADDDGDNPDDPVKYFVIAGAVMGVAFIVVVTLFLYMRSRSRARRTGYKKYQRANSITDRTHSIEVMPRNTPRKGSEAEIELPETGDSHREQ